ncbi:ribonuclease H-like domain-containing protein [Tanacetum coccineum]
MKGQDNPLIPNLHPHLLNSTIKKPIIVPSSYQPKKTHKPRKTIRTTKISQSSRSINLVAYETVYKEWEDKMERAVTTASSLDAEQDSGNINRIQSMATLNESFPQGTDSGSGPRYKIYSENDPTSGIRACVETLNKKNSIGSPFELEAFLDSDYRGASLDKKSTTEYVAAANCCGQVLWIQNQMMDYGFNFMNTKIHIDNESTISVIKNPVAHSRTKHIEIRFHFIRDCYEKRLIEVIKIHTDSNVADLLTKGFDVTRFNFLVEGLQAISAAIDGHEKLITEDSLRRHLKLDDAEGLSSLFVRNYICGITKSKEDGRSIFLKQQFEGVLYPTQKGFNKRAMTGVDSLSFDDLYNNLRVFENDVKGSTASSSSSQNVAFFSRWNTQPNAISLMQQEPCWLDKEPKLSATIAIRQGILLESVESKEIKIIGGGMHGTLELRMGAELERRRTLKHGDLLLEKREQLSDARIEIKAYSQGLKKVEAQLVAHQQGQLRYDGILSYENEVLQSIFMNKESELEKQPLNDRFVIVGGMYAVPPRMTGNYMPFGPDIEVILHNFTYGPKQTQPSESESQTSEFDTCESNISTEPSELVSEPVVNESNVECQSKVWSDAPIIEEYESDSEDEYMSIPTKEQATPSFANQQVKTPRETVKNQFTHSQKPKVDKKELGYGFTVRACFVCGSLNHLIRDCDFHEKRMARKAELNNKLSRNSGQREIRPIWNNVQRINKQNQFVPSAVLTRTGKIPVNTAKASSTKNFSTARQSFNRQTVLTSTAMKVNTVKPIVNRVRPANVFYKTHSPSSRPFKKTTVLRTDFSKQKVNTAKVNAVSTVGGKRETAVKPSAGCNWRPQRYNWHNDYPHRALKNKGIVDSGCSRHMTGNKAYLAEFQDFNGGPVAFGGSKGYITGKGKIKTGKLDFEDVCFVKELQHFNLFSVSQMCDKKNKVLFTDSECLVLSPEFKLPDENQVLLKIPRQNNMYSFNLENIVPSGGLACLIAKAITDESNKWHRRLGHVNFKNLNKLVKGNLVRGLPSKIFQNDHTCVACQKGKQHKASCKAKSVSSISHSLQLLHIDLFGSTSVRSLNHKTYCLVITDDFSRFSWVFFLRTKDETSAILKDFIRQMENQLNPKVKTIRSDNGTEFKNKDVIELCGSKGIKREYNQRIKLTFMKVNKKLTKMQVQKTLLMHWILKNKEDRNMAPRLKRQEKEANEEIAEASGKKWNKETENLVLQGGVVTASPLRGLSLSDPTNPEEDDSEIPPLEDIYQNSTNGIFTTSSFVSMRVAVAEFTNLETIVNVSPIPTSRIHSSHPSALILGDPTSAVQTRSKVNKSSGAHAFVSYVQKQKRTNHMTLHHCLFALLFLVSHENQEDFKKALED